MALVTVAGQALAWLVVGVRQSSSGRRITWGLAATIVTASGFLVVAGSVGGVLDSAPTTLVVIAAVNVSGGPTPEFWLTAVLLALLTTAAFAAGLRACSWALRQPGDSSTDGTTRRVSRRSKRPPGGEIRAIDRASVWRSTSLRRGLIVLGVLPGLVALTAGLEWSTLILLPGLVSAGAGLLFGVNAFCLDGSGAVWLGSLPSRPATVFWSKTRVVAETCLVSVAITVSAGSLRASRGPTPSELAALLCCAVVAQLMVVATCMELSVTRPHRADLRGPRDTPAPPGVMAAYSARLALSTTLMAVFYSALSGAADWRWPVLFAVPALLLSCRRLLRSARMWQDELVRSRVVTTVATG